MSETQPKPETAAQEAGSQTANRPIVTSVEAPEAWKRVVRAEVERAFFDKEYAGRLKKAAKSHHKPGFRKGRTPLAIVEKELGDMVRAETIEALPLLPMAELHTPLGLDAAAKVLAAAGMDAEAAITLGRARAIEVTVPLLVPREPLHEVLQGLLAFGLVGYALGLAQHHHRAVVERVVEGRARQHQSVEPRSQPLQELGPRGSGPEEQADQQRREEERTPPPQAR